MFVKKKHFTINFIHLLTHFMEKSPSCEANQVSASQETPHISCNSKANYHIYVCPPPVPILHQTHIHHTQSISNPTYLYQSVSLSPPAQSVPSSSTHSLLTSPSSSLSVHNISSLVPSTALDVQHILKPFMVLLVRCAALPL